MHSTTLIFLFILVIIILIVALIYATDAANAIGSNRDKDLQQAHWYLAWTVSIIWIIIALAIIGIVCLIIFGPEFLPLFGKTIVYLFLAGMIIAIVAVGVVSAISASYIRASVEKDSVGDAYEDTIIAAVVALGSIGIVLVGYGITWYRTKTPDDADYDNTDNNENINTNTA